MKDKFMQISIFLLVSLISTFLVFDTINFIFMAMGIAFLALSFFNLKVSILTLLLSRELVFNSIYYFTGVGSSPPAVIFYMMSLVFLAILMIIREVVTLKFEIFNTGLIIFTLYLFISGQFLSSYTPYAMEKLFFFSIALVGCFFIQIFIQKKFDVIIFIQAIFFQALMLLTVSLISGLSYKLLNGQFLLNRFTVLGINPIWIGRLLFYGALSNIYFIFKSKKWFYTLALIILTCFQVYYGFITGSRAPVLAFILGVLVFSIFYWKIKLSRLVIIFSITLLLLFIVYKGVLEDSTNRFTGGGSGKSSSQLRILAQYQAFTIFQENYIIGAGFGAFNQFYLQYPHNVFSEITCETGLLGLFMFLVLLGVTFKRIMQIYKNDNNLEIAFMVAVVSASFFNANLSGHIGFNPVFWLSIFLTNQYYLVPVSKEDNNFQEHKKTLIMECYATKQ